MEDNKILVAVAAGVLLIVLTKLKSLFAAKPKLNLPPGPWTLPVIGSIHHLVTNPPLLYRTLRVLSQKHGPLMMLRVGEVPMLVVSSAEAAEAVLKTHDTSFADRFASATLASITYDKTDLGMAPYGERWRQLRKICVLELLSAARVQTFQRIREEEVALFMDSLAASASSSAVVDLSKGIKRLINDAFMRACVGSRCKYQDEYLHAFHEAVRLTSGLTLADLFPSSRIMQMLGTAPRKALACREKMQRILEEIMRETKEAMDRGDKVARDSFLGVLLTLQKEGRTSVELNNETISSLLFDLFGAGSDTSSSVMIWCITELIRTPAVMAKVQAEVREAFKGKSRITEDDLAKVDLSYLKLVLKESMRLHAHLPFLLPRQCRETCQVMGYDIPKGTAVFVNAWAIARDPKYWEDGDEFKPERFQNNDLDFKGTNFEYLPFGSGRRMCPGVNLGLANINLALVRLLYHFDWKLPDGMEPKDVEICEAVGLIAIKKTSLILHPVTRIPPANDE
ncbi:hypothetical protein EJB05_22207 [Eragrostis curvula]|uniref:Cytochrome P450 n=1 Tax=Eragrostis curvula TaxID=38414 RepID=A0A5J9V579_9POAL|nr:hypothetical protein EJB05_22207 [Eragrostis curvula]